MKTPGVILAAVVAGVLIGGATYKFVFDRPTPAPSPSPVIVQDQTSPAQPSDDQTQPATPQPSTGKIATIYVSGDGPNADDNGLVPQHVKLTHGESPAKSALEALIQAPDSPLPNGTQLRSIKLADRLATVDFSSEFKDNFHGGDSQEAEAVNSILKTLGEFKSIDKVQIVVEGRPIDTLGSNFDISSPLNVIRPTGFQQATTEGMDRG